MGDTWQKGRDSASAGVSAEDKVLLNGSPDEKIKAWLNLTKDDSGHLKAGVSISLQVVIFIITVFRECNSLIHKQDWMGSLVPNLKLVSTNPTGPHPSCVFSYTIQPENCNRLRNLHGGCAATLFDFCTTLPLALVNRPGFWQFMGVSRTLNVTYMRPVPEGEEVLLECEIVQVGKKLATLRGIMRKRSDGSLLAVCEHGKVNIDAEPKI
ncbi:hypothetical protein G7046_g1627 [Stylonectria norvegica]|nr:hypothetical protein G7046_g1627 [Stylonectria norvegica]